MLISDIISALENWAPPSYAESYDNVGLITGDRQWTCTGAIICLDAIESVIDEAIEKNSNLVIAHHPIVFSGLKRITGQNYIERTLIKAIKHDIAIYAIHTNLDNISTGVNQMICDKLELINTRILAPKKGILKKLYTYVPLSDAESVRQALFSAGAGHIGLYDECSFNTEGTGTFRALKGANPHKGNIEERHTEDEIKIEVILPQYLERKVLSALKAHHPYEEVAYELISLDNSVDIGSGMIGELEDSVDTLSWLSQIKSTFHCGSIRHTALVHKDIKRVAVCGGSGSFLLEAAVKQKADIFISSDYKYHQFFDADGRIIIADIGHYESEQFSINLIYRYLSEKFTNFAFLLTEQNTNPVKYL